MFLSNALLRFFVRGDTEHDVGQVDSRFNLTHDRHRGFLDPVANQIAHSHVNINSALNPNIHG